jgi:hypothetical protein
MCYKCSKDRYICLSCKLDRSYYQEETDKGTSHLSNCRATSQHRVHAYNASSPNFSSLPLQVSSFLLQSPLQGKEANSITPIIINPSNFFTKSPEVLRVPKSLLCFLLWASRFSSLLDEAEVMPDLLRRQEAVQIELRRGLNDFFVAGG